METLPSIGFGYTLNIPYNVVRERYLATEQLPGVCVLLKNSPEGVVILGTGQVNNVFALTCP